MSFLESFQAQLLDLIGFTVCLPAKGSACYTKYDALTVGWGFVGFFVIYWYHSCFLHMCINFPFFISLFSVCLTLCSFVASLLAHNASKVDQLWSLLPVFYAWHFHYHDSLLHPTSRNYRSLYVCLLITLWGARLTFNFWRKGG
jgi:hypothetical protein